MKVVRIPSILSELIISALTGIDGREFTQISGCPYCSGPVRFHDIRAKRFAGVIENGQKRSISVRVHRFYCRYCGKLCYARSPFYPNIKFGSPVADLYMTLARNFSFNHTGRILQEIGVVVDRGTIRNISSLDLPPVSYATLYGLPIPISICYLSDLVSSKSRYFPVTEADILEVCGLPMEKKPEPQYGPESEFT